jgi:hypothetical protein
MRLAGKTHLFGGWCWYVLPPLSQNNNQQQTLFDHHLKLISDVGNRNI